MTVSPVLRVLVGVITLFIVEALIHLGFEHRLQRTGEDITQCVLNVLRRLHKDAPDVPWLARSFSFLAMCSSAFPFPLWGIRGRKG